MRVSACTRCGGTCAWTADTHRSGQGRLGEQPGHGVVELGARDRQIETRDPAGSRRRSGQWGTAGGGSLEQPDARWAEEGSAAGGGPERLRPWAVNSSSTRSAGRGRGGATVCCAPPGTPSPPPCRCCRRGRERCPRGLRWPGQPGRPACGDRHRDRSGNRSPGGCRGVWVARHRPQRVVRAGGPVGDGGCPVSARVG